MKNRSSAITRCPDEIMRTFQGNVDCGCVYSCKGSFQISASFRSWLWTSDGCIRLGQPSICLATPWGVTCNASRESEHGRFARVT